jgi:hypothetical protein
MPAEVGTLILEWKRLRNALIQISRTYPDEPGLHRPLASLGSWPDGALPTESDASLAHWRSSIIDVVEQTRQFFNYHNDLARFNNSGLVQELRTRERYRLRVADCLIAMDELLNLLGWHDRPLGVRVYERMKAKGHKQEAVAAAFGISPSTLSRFRDPRRKRALPNEDLAIKYLAGMLEGFEDQQTARTAS